MKLKLTAVLALFPLALAACGDDDDDGTGPTQTAQVRFVNAGTFATGTDVFVGNGGSAITANLGAGGVAAACVAVPAGNQILTFRQTGTNTNIATAAAFTFQPNQSYTVVLNGTGTNGQAVILSDNDAPAPGANQNAIRFFNASGAAMDYYLTTQGGAMTNATQANLANNTASNNATSGFSLFGNDLVQLRGFAAGSATTGTPAVNFTVPALTGDRQATVVVRGAAANPQVLVASGC